jgi:hypothetical protein
MILERLLEVKQISTCVDDSPKKPTIENKTQLLGSQRVGPESEQLGATGLGYLVVSFETQ